MDRFGFLVVDHVTVFAFAPVMAYPQISDAQIAEWFRPVVFLHSKEEYWPCDFEDYLAHCTLKERKTGKVVEQKVNSDVLAKYHRDPADRALCLDCEPEFWSQRPLDMREVPIYARVDSTDPELYWIQYWMFYPYNGAFDIGCFCYAQCCASNKAIIKAGAHQSDFEHVSVYVNKQTMKLTRMYYSAHGDADGKWLSEHEITMYDNNRHPVVYSAYHSHAHYAEPGCVPRIFGCANDFAEEGVVWDTDNLRMVDDMFPIWQTYVGGLGFPDSGDVPRNKESWIKEPNVSATLWSRLFRYLNFSCCCQPVIEPDAPPVPRPSLVTAAVYPAVR